MSAVGSLVIGFIKTIMFSMVKVLCLGRHKGKGLTTSLVPRMESASTRASRG